MDNQSTSEVSFEKELASNPELYFSREELGDAFQLARSTVCKMITGIDPSGVRERALVWLISDVSTLNDARLIQAQRNREQEANLALIKLDPAKMPPSDRRTHYQAEDLKQSALLKQRKNDLESCKLIPSYEVQTCLAEAFKKVALTLDTLPDALERDGYLNSRDVEGAIALIDKARTKLADELANLK